MKWFLTFFISLWVCSAQAQVISCGNAGGNVGNYQLVQSGGCSPTASAVTFDAKGTLRSGTIVNNTNDTSLTIGSGNVLVVLLDICGGGGAQTAVVSMTWNGVSLTQVLTQTNGCRTDIWALLGPATGNRTLNITTSANLSFSNLFDLSFNNVNQASIAAAFPHNASGTGSSLSITSATSHMVAATGGASSTTPSSVSGTTLYIDATNGGWGQYDNGATPTVSVTETGASGGTWSFIGVDISN